MRRQKVMQYIAVSDRHQEGEEPLCGIELLRTGDRARRVFLNPSRKLSLLFVGLGVRGNSQSKPPYWVLCIGRVIFCWGILFSLFIIPGDAAKSVGGSDTLSRIAGSDVGTRLYASKL